MRVESPSSPRERCSVSAVRRSIISMRDSNFIKKDEKNIPHFRRTALFPSGGGKPEGKVGEQYSHVRGHAPYFMFEHDETRRKGVSNTPMSGDETFPEGKVGEQHSPRDVHSISLSSTMKPAGRGNNTSMSGDAHSIQRLSARHLCTKPHDYRAVLCVEVFVVRSARVFLGFRHRRHLMPAMASSREISPAFARIMSLTSESFRR